MCRSCPRHNTKHVNNVFTRLSFNFKWVVVIFIYLSYIPNLKEDYQIKFNELQSSILYTYILRQIATHKTYMVFEVIVQRRVKNYMSKSTLKKKSNIRASLALYLFFFFTVSYILFTIQKCNNVLKSLHMTSANQNRWFWNILGEDTWKPYTRLTLGHNVCAVIDVHTFFKRRYM